VPNFLNVRFYCVATSGEDGVALRPKTVVKTDPELVALLKEGGGGASADRARDFLLTLATCNTIVPIVVDDDDDSAAAAARLLEYQGESPDEQALVYAAAAYGYTLVERTSGHVTVDVLGSRQRYVRACRSSPYRFSCFASVGLAVIIALLFYGELFVSFRVRSAVECIPVWLVLSCSG
jgi:magnesium-transporting ATPase (P-type)